MRLPGKRRLRSPKLVLHPRGPSTEEAPKDEAKKAAAPKPPPAPPSAPEPPVTSETTSDPEPEGDPGGEDTPSWSPRMRKDELRAVAEGMGIEVPDEWTKDQIIAALEAASE